MQANLIANSERIHGSEPGTADELEDEDVEDDIHSDDSGGHDGDDTEDAGAVFNDGEDLESGDDDEEEDGEGEVNEGPPDADLEQFGASGSQSRRISATDDENLVGGDRVIDDETMDTLESERNVVMNIAGSMMSNRQVCDSVNPR